MLCYDLGMKVRAKLGMGPSSEERAKRAWLARLDEEPSWKKKTAPKVALPKVRALALPNTVAAPSKARVGPGRAIAATISNLKATLPEKAANAALLMVVRVAAPSRARGLPGRLPRLADRLTRPAFPSEPPTAALV